MSTIKQTMRWHMNFHINNPSEALPLPGAIAVAEATDITYVNAGITRQSEKTGRVFQYSLEGQGRLKVGSEVFNLPEETGFLCEVSDPEISYFYPEEQTTPWRFLYIAFHESTNLTRRVNEELGFLFNFKKDSPLIRSLLDYKKRISPPIVMDAGEASLIVHKLIAALYDQRGKKSGQKDSASSFIVRRAYALISEKMNIPYNASMLADDLGITPEHLVRVFKQQNEDTPYKVITQRKLSRACELLSQTNMRSKEIAMSLGYDPGSHFTRLFKREIGLSPGEYRLG